MRRSVLILLIVLVAFALRVYRLDYFSLRGDESFTVLFIQKPFAQMWNEIRTVEPNPPLMYLLLRAWTGLAGTGEFATRFFSVFWGVLSVPLIYRLARTVLPQPIHSLKGSGDWRVAKPPANPRTLSPPRSPPDELRKPTSQRLSPPPATSPADGEGMRGFRRAGVAKPPPLSGPHSPLSPPGRGARGEGASAATVRTMLPGGRERARSMALIAAFLMAINPYQIWHSQDVRNYSMWPALSMLALIFFWRWSHPEPDTDRVHPRLLLLAFVVAELAALYTHYYEAFILIALNLYAFFFLIRRRSWSGKSPSLVEWLAAQIALAFVYLPFPLLISNRVASYGEGSGQQGVALWDIWQRTFSVFTLGETLDESVRQIAWIPLALALALIVIARWRLAHKGFFFLLYAGVPTVAVFILNLFRPLFLERYLNGIAPAYYLLFAWGIGTLAASPYPAWVSRGLATAALGVFALLALVALANYSFDPAYAKSPDWRALAQAIDARHLDGDVILQNFPETSLVYYDRSGLPLVVYPQSYLADAQTARALTNMNRKYRRVWFIPSVDQYWDPEQYVEAWLDSHDELLAETRVASFRLELYATSASSSP